MKILHVVPSLLPESGGPSRTIPELCRALAGTGTDITLFSTHQPGSKLTVDPSKEPYEVILFPGSEGWAGARQIYRAIKDRAREFDIIHLHSLWNAVVTSAAVAARRSDLPYIIAPRGMLSDACLRQSNYSLKRTYAWVLDRRTVEGAARVHFLNANEQRASQNDWFRYPEYLIAPNGIDLNVMSPGTGWLRERFPELANRRIMLFIGRLHPIKGLELQLEALGRLIGKHPDLFWVLVGPDDGEWQRLNALTRSARLEEHVKWIGPLMGDERFSALADADVLVQTSLYECQSTTVNEALAVGVPLVVTDSINYAEVQTSGAGYVVRRDAAELANAIDSILLLADRGNAMRDAGRRFANEVLSWPKIAATVSAAYSEAIAERKSDEMQDDVLQETTLGASA